ncbi:hypothetical protein I302_104113 [Kwoniella bestiolae CBS 10118]|uniref:Uncharacterized protein n=1 Tax=Kwoniella bestiolae CBS 10118 TaxID=1296100 RepID=A0A1B9GAE0_9TREE|nr:hypothetical protein I302_02821 [Kwoniella bestiolae CBS 10118]OCF27971.1 hypothetical protein I302_02821 [Kwoniella bestiolae CBS 10118]
MLTRALIPHLPDLTILNVNPGLTRTNLGREFKLTLSPSTVYFILLYMVNSRSARMAARNLTSASAWKGDSQDYWSSCVPVASENTWLYSGKGMKAVEVFFKEMIDEVEKISPGCTSTTQSK